MAIANLFVLILGGGLLLSPVVLHLLMQPKPKPIVFPAVRFLQKTASSNRRQLRLRQIILLFLRCLVVLLPAAALAGPAVASAEFGGWLTLVAVGSLLVLITALLALAWFQERRSALLLSVAALFWLLLTAWLGWQIRQLSSDSHQGLIGQAEAPVSAVLLIDTSPRMSYRWENRTSLERAQDLAVWTLGQLPDESQVSVVETRDDQPFFSVDASAAKKRIGTLETCYTPRPIPEILERVGELLKEAKHERHEIYVFTDLTRSSWASPRSAELREQLAKQTGWSLFVIDVGSPQAVNLGLSVPQLQSAVVTRHGRLPIRFDLLRLGPATERSVQLEIEKPDNTLPTIRDGRTVIPEQTWQQTTSLKIGENGTASGSFVFSEPLPTGIHHGRISLLGSDGLEFDNTRYFTIEVRPSWKVLLVHPASVSPLDIQQIISPVDEGDTSSSPYECTIIDQQQISQIDFSVYHAVILLNPLPIEDSSWKQLRDYVAAGGGLFLSLGQNAARGAIIDERFQSEMAQAVMGGRLTLPWVRREGDVFLRPDSLAHPMFQAFRAIESSLNWSAFPVYQHWGMELGENPQGPRQVLASYSDRQPALVEHEIDKGRVLVMTTPLAEPRSTTFRRPWNDLFVGRPLPAWMLTRELVAYLVQLESDTLNLSTGQSAQLANDPRLFPEIYTLYSPKLDQATTKVTAANGQVRYRFTERPGHYRLKGTLDGPVVRGFSVNLQPGDTDLVRLDAPDLESILGPGNYQLARDQSQIQRQQGTARKGREFYPLLVMMLTVVFALEYLLSNRFYRSAP